MRLAVIGAGAKAVAVAAKAAALRELGVPTPEIIAVERAEVAANWRAAGGWTDGRHRLGTSPEKDVGFPYRSALLPGRNAELDQIMMRFSWQAFLVATNQFAEWIDRGRPAPRHQRWAQYLRWVAEAADLSVVRGQVDRLALDAGRWVVGAASASVWADAVMVTGPGQPERSILPDNPRVWSIGEFWRRAAEPGRIDAGRVAVIGGGEAAASILHELFAHRVSAITVISPQVTLFTRGEGYFENRLFSDPTDWETLPMSERRDAVARTDRGVFSAQVQQVLLDDDRVRHLRGRVAHAVERVDGIRLTLRSVRGAPLETAHGFDLVIDGSGADPLWFVPLLGEDVRDLVELALGGPLTGGRLEESIGYDLSVTGVTPKLFLPNVAGLNQGPGFPNLSCLGLLSDRVLGADLAATNESQRSIDEYQPVR